MLSLKCHRLYWFVVEPRICDAKVTLASDFYLLTTLKGLLQMLKWHGNVEIILYAMVEVVIASYPTSVGAIFMHF